MKCESWTAHQDEGGSGKGEECHVDKRGQLGQGLPQLLMQGLAGCLTPACVTRSRPVAFPRRELWQPLLSWTTPHAPIKLRV